MDYREKVLSCGDAAGRYLSNCGWNLIRTSTACYVINLEKMPSDSLDRASPERGDDAKPWQRQNPFESTVVSSKLTQTIPY